MVSSPDATDQRLDVRDRAGVVEVAEDQGVRAGAQIDAVAGAEGRAERDRIRSGAADDALDVGDRRGVGEVAERELVAAVAEVDRGLREPGSRA